jgi:glycosyltransferase involved in cell wall biosynthesis
MDFANVLFIGPEDKYGGIGAVLKMYEKNIPIFNYIPTYPSNKKRSIILFYIKSVIKTVTFLITNRHIQFIHIHAASKGSYLRKVIIAFIGKAFGKKVIFHIHAGYFDQFYNGSSLFKGLIRHQLSKMDKVICLTDDWRTFYNEQLGLHNVEVLGNPVAIRHPSTKDFNANSLILLYLGNLSENKGIFDLLHYLEQNVYFKGHRIKIWIGGKGDINQLESILKSHPNLKAGVEYYGWVNEELKSDLFQKADILILPSYYEGLPVSVLEALAHSKAIISTRVGGIPAVVKERENGWLFAPGEFQQLDSIFDQIFTENELLKLYSQNSFSKAMEFAPNVILSKLQTIYQST